MDKLVQQVACIVQHNFICKKIRLRLFKRDSPCIQFIAHWCVRAGLEKKLFCKISIYDTQEVVFEGGAELSQSKSRFVAQHEINDNCIYGTRDLSIAAMSLFLSCETNKDFV